MTDHAELIEPSPVDRGEFVGDIFYGDPTNSTRGTHRWTGAAWEALPTDAEVLTLMLAEARACVAALVAERDALRRVVADIAEQRLSGAAIRWHEEEYGDDGEPDFIGAYDIFIQRARAALAQGGEKP